MELNLTKGLWGWFSGNPSSLNWPMKSRIYVLLNLPWPNIMNAKYTVRPKVWVLVLISPPPSPPPPRKEIHRLCPIMDLKIYSLERNPRLWLDSWQSLETFAKIIPVTSICGGGSWKYIFWRTISYANPSLLATKVLFFSLDRQFVTQSTYIYRVQSRVWCLPNYWRPPPSPPSEGYTLAGRWGGGGVNISEDDRH